MKKLLKLSLVTMLAIFALSVVSYAATGGGKHHKAVPKENKKFTIVTFYFTGTTTSDITDPNKWSTTAVTCGDNNTHLCSITFDAAHTNPSYALTVSGKPNPTVLGDVQTDLVTGGSTPTSYTIESGTITINLKS